MGIHLPFTAPCLLNNQVMVEWSNMHGCCQLSSGMVGNTRVPVSQSHMLGHSNHNHLFVYSKSAGVGSYNTRFHWGRQASHFLWLVVNHQNTRLWIDFPLDLMLYSAYVKNLLVIHIVKKFMPVMRSIPHNELMREWWSRDFYWYQTNRWEEVSCLLLNCRYQGAYDWYHLRLEANYKIVTLFMFAATTQSFYTTSGRTIKINLITR